MYGGYAYFNSTEVWNNQRVVAYLKGDPAAGIPGLALPSTVVSADCGCDAICLYCDQGAGEDGAFTSPRLDDAPWFDSGVPDSEDFAGLFVTELTGFDSTIRRDFSEGAISGGSLGPMRLGGRCMTVTGWLMAKTCCGAEYGLRWLQEALMGNNFCEDCAYGDLYMIKCCPPEGDSCYTNEVGVTDTVPDLNVWFTVTDNADGTYTFEIDDSNQANLISDPAGVPNNTDGPIPSCYGAGNSFRFVVADDLGAIFTFLVPQEAITLDFTAPSGSGASLTFMVDTNVEGSCDDVARDILNFTEQVTEYLAVYPSATLVVMTSPTQVRCFETLSGYNPEDYVRLMHRVGITDGPKVIERRGTCCSNDCGCVNIKVQFTLCSEFPYIFSDIDWCIQDQTFDLDNCYCLDLRKLCNSCSTEDATKFVEVETTRPTCPIDVLHDGAWCPVGWDVAEDGCPPIDCSLDINEVVEYDPDENTDCTGSATDDNPCIIGLYDDKTWIPLNFELSDGFPPKFCDLVVLFGGTCGECPETQDEIVEFTVDATGGQWAIFVDANGSVQNVNVNATASAATLQGAIEGLSNIDPGDVLVTGGPGDDGGTTPYTVTFFTGVLGEPASAAGFDVSLSGGASSVSTNVTQEGCVSDNNNCLIRVIYDEGTGSTTWEPIRWSGDLPAFPECDCVEIAEICVIADEGSCPADPTQCPINIVCDTDYLPARCTTRQSWAAFFYRYNGSPPFVPPATPSFPDLLTSNQFYLEIEWAFSVGLLNGYPDGTFRPETPVSRQVAATTYYRDAGSPAFVPPATPSFSDVGTGDGFYLEIEWSHSEGIFLGYPDGTFRPTDCLTRRAAAITFYRYANEYPTFVDVPSTYPFFTEIEWSHDQGIFFGYADSTFQPTNDLLRRTAALTFYREAGSPPFIPPGVPTFLDVPLTDAQYLEIEWVNSVGIMTGVPGPNFLPDTDLSRQAAAVAFYNQNGAPPFVPPAVQTFTDVSPIHPFYLQIEWCAANGIVFGFGDGTFRPTDPTSRQAMASFFYRNAGSPPFVVPIFVPSLPPFFADVPESDTNYLQIQWMHDNGISFGFPNSRSWEPIGWDYDPEGVFPPENCTLYIATVNGAEQDLSPIKQLVEVPYDEFVPDCGPFPVQPPPPTLFTAGECFCEPWEQARVCCTFTNPADWNEATTYVEVQTGSEEMRNLKIEAYRNPFGEKVPCPCDPADDFWDCRDPCATILVPQLPKNSKLIIDSRQRIAQLVLSSGRTVNALRYIFSGDGKPFGWFDIGQCSTFCIVAQADCRNTAADAMVSVGAVGRYVASGW